MSLLFQPVLAWLVPTALLFYWGVLRSPLSRRAFVTLLSLSLLAFLMGSERVLPLGASYLLFRIIHYALGRYRGTINPGPWTEVLAYLVFFPLLPAGPLEPYNSFFEKQAIRFDGRLFQSGMRRIVWGYFKKSFVVDLCFAAVLQTYWGAEPGAAVSRPLLFVSLKFFQAFVDLSAYTDIALGLSALFGYRIMENFDSPFTQTSVAKFWQHWHMSVTRWCRDHVFFPVLGYLRSPAIAIYASMLVMGLWHGLSLNWFAWGVYHATGILVSQWLSRKIQASKAIRLWRHPALRLASVALTLLYVILGFSFVSLSDFPAATSLYVASLTALNPFL